jgi:hypothetical protein
MKVSRKMNATRRHTQRKRLMPALILSGQHFVDGSQRSTSDGRAPVLDGTARSGAAPLMAETPAVTATPARKPSAKRRAISAGSDGGGSVNIKVAVRVRGGLDAKASVVSCTGNEMTITGAGVKGEPAQFAFDHCYGPEATQEQVYDDLGSQILDYAFEGYNGTIFAYGQTGSGKSHSIMGTPTQLGIVPRLAVELFERVHSAPSSAAFEVTATYVELYNEVLCDLLTPGNTRLKIRQHVSTGIYVEGLTEVQVSNHEEVERLIAEGNRARQVAATRMNERSSRSHAIMTIMLRQRHAEADGSTRTLSAKISLVDLAGSERADLTASTSQLQEGAAINKSLSALGNVINALTEGAAAAGKGTPKGGTARGGAEAKGEAAAATHVPYRSSKLTRLLEESLGGNTVTVMLATVSPEARNLRESLATLKYAQRAKKITNTKNKNEAKEDKRRIRELTAEIARLHEQLAAGGGIATLRQSDGAESEDAATGESSADAEAARTAAAQLAEARGALDRVREEGRLAAAASIAAAAREQELEAELEASRANHAALEKRLTRTSDELSVLQGASRSAELEAHWLRQQLQMLQLRQADDAHRIASLEEESGACRRQLQAAMRQAADAREEAAEAVAQRRAAERQLHSTEAELQTARRAEASGELRAASGELRASAELIGIASREKAAHTTLLETSTASFERLLLQKDAAVRALESKLQLAAERDESRSLELAALQSQLGARAAAVEELTEAKAEGLRELMAAQALAERRADEASRARHLAEKRGTDIAMAEREIELLKRRVQVKEVHVAQLTSENGALSEQLKQQREQMDTPEAMLREMLRMTEVELRLKSQLAAEKEVKQLERIRHLESQLGRLGVAVGEKPPAPKPMSFASFFQGLKLGGGANWGTETTPSRADERADEEPISEDDEVDEDEEGVPPVRRPASFGRAAVRRASFGNARADARPPLPPSPTATTTAPTAAHPHRTPTGRIPHAASRRASFGAGGRTPQTPAEVVSATAEAVEDAGKAAAQAAAEASKTVAENAGKAADAAGRAVGGAVDNLQKGFGSLFSSIKSALPPLPVLAPSSSPGDAGVRHPVQKNLFDKGMAQAHGAAGSSHRHRHRRSAREEEDRHQNHEHQCNQHHQHHHQHHQHHQHQHHQHQHAAFSSDDDVEEEPEPESDSGSESDSLHAHGRARTGVRTNVTNVPNVTAPPRPLPPRPLELPDDDDRAAGSDDELSEGSSESERGRRGRSRPHASARPRRPSARKAAGKAAGSNRRPTSRSLADASGLLASPGRNIASGAPPTPSSSASASSTRSLGRSHELTTPPPARWHGHGGVVVGESSTAWSTPPPIGSAGPAAVTSPNSSRRARGAVPASKRPPRSHHHGLHEPSPGPSPRAAPSPPRRGPKATPSSPSKASPLKGGSPYGHGRPARRVPSWPAGASASDGKRSKLKDKELFQSGTSARRAVSFARSPSHEY